MHLSGRPPAPLTGRTEMTRTRPGRATRARGMCGGCRVSFSQSSEVTKIGTVERGRSGEGRNLQSSRVYVSPGRTYEGPKFQIRVRRTWDERVAATSRECSLIGKRRGKLFGPFSPVPPPLPGCAGSPTSHPPQVTCGRLGSEEVAAGQGKTKKQEQETGDR